MFLNGRVSHGRHRSGTVPMLLTRRNPNHVARPNLLDGATPALNETAAGRHDQGLAKRMSVPRRAGAWLKSDTRTDRPRRSVCLKQGVNSNGAREVFDRPLGRRL